MGSKNGSYVVAAKIEGRVYNIDESKFQSLTFLIDTGAGPSRINEEVAEELGLVYSRIVKTQSTTDVMKNTQSWIGIIEIPEIGFKPSPMQIAETVKNRHHGLLGLDILRQMVLTADGPNRTFTLFYDQNHPDPLIADTDY